MSNYEQIQKRRQKIYELLQRFDANSALTITQIYRLIGPQGHRNSGF
ncbi:MAG: hypothetical protein HN353_00070 [Bdellovibrionales bacterium]|nr:hypothetical protein [Bdellovibrionales bacterium]MBT3527167.1 hypothetical protein [Bdellovibrionales bacterium]MBT7669265.1 hypothetical protein [Bdellovibrionales bacterium]MBT7767568.1 hypothetical protein [Bdellovibrionales bacterium]